MKLPSTRWLVAASLSASLGATALPASATDYLMTDIGALGGLYEKSYATGLNASGQVVGFGYRGGWFYQEDTENHRAFVTGAGGQGITGLGMLAGDHGSQARGINDAGRVVGTSFNAAGSSTAFTAAWANPALRSLGTLGGVSSKANAVNGSGQVVGTFTTAAGTERAYITAPDAGAMRPLEIASVIDPPASFVATGVNDSGQVVGSYGGAPYSTRHGFVTGPSGTALRRLPGPEVAPGHESFSPQVRVFAVNDEGQTVGVYYERGDAFLKEADGTDLLLDFSSAPHYKPGNMGHWQQYGPNTETLALAVNASGQVAGQMVRNDWPVNYAFITGEDGSNLVEVNSLSFVNHSGPLGFDFVSATGVNDSGAFVANGSNGHAYLITVVPEPATIALWFAGLGLGLVGAAARRTRQAGSRCKPLTFVNVMPGNRQSRWTSRPARA